MVMIDNMFLNILIVQIRTIPFSDIETWEITGHYQANTPVQQHTNTQIQHDYATDKPKGKAECCNCEC